MDRYIVTSPLGGRVRAKRSTADGITVLKTLSKDVIFDVEGTVTEAGFVWLYIPAHKGWMRGDMAERYAHSAEPTPPPVPNSPADLTAMIADTDQMIQRLMAFRAMLETWRK